MYGKKKGLRKRRVKFAEYMQVHDGGSLTLAESKATKESDQVAEKDENSKQETDGDSPFIKGSENKDELIESLTKKKILIQLKDINERVFQTLDQYDQDIKGSVSSRGHIREGEEIGVKELKQRLLEMMTEYKGVCLKREQILVTLANWFTQDGTKNLMSFIDERYTSVHRFIDYSRRRKSILSESQSTKIEVEKKKLSQSEKIEAEKKLSAASQEIDSRYSLLTPPPPFDSPDLPDEVDTEDIDDDVADSHDGKIASSASHSLEDTKDKICELLKLIGAMGCSDDHTTINKLIQSLGEQWGELEAINAEVEDRREAHTQGIAHSNSVIARMADENATLRRDYKLLDDNLLEAKLTIRYLQSKIDQMKSIKPPSTPESPRTKKDDSPTDSAHKQISELTTKAAALEAENQELKLSYSSLTRKNEHLKESYFILQKNYDDIVENLEYPEFEAMESVVALPDYNYIPKQHSPSTVKQRVRKSSTALPVHDSTTSKHVHRISSTEPVHRISSTSEPVHRISSTEPVHRISSTSEPVHRISSTSEPVHMSSTSELPVRGSSTSNQPFRTSSPPINVSICSKQSIHEKSTFTQSSPTSKQPVHKASTSVHESSTKQPVRKSSTSKGPVHESFTSKPPARKSSTSEEPVHEISTSKQPVSKLSTSKGPVHESSTSKPPARKLATSEEPVYEFSTSKQPVSKSSTSKGPVHESSTVFTSKQPAHTPKQTDTVCVPSVSDQPVLKSPDLELPGITVISASAESNIVSSTRQELLENSIEGEYEVEIDRIKRAKQSEVGEDSSDYSKQAYKRLLIKKNHRLKTLLEQNEELKRKLQAVEVAQERTEETQDETMEFNVDYARRINYPEESLLDFYDGRETASTPDSARSSTTLLGLEDRNMLGIIRPNHNEAASSENSMLMQIISNISIGKHGVAGIDELSNSDLHSELQEVCNKIEEYLDDCSSEFPASYDGDFEGKGTAQRTDIEYQRPDSPYRRDIVKLITELVVGGKKSPPPVDSKALSKMRQHLQTVYNASRTILRGDEDHSPTNLKISGVHYNSPIKGPSPVQVFGSTRGYGIRPPMAMGQRFNTGGTDSHKIGLEAIQLSKPGQFMKAAYRGPPLTVNRLNTAGTKKKFRNEYEEEPHDIVAMKPHKENFSMRYAQDSPPLQTPPGEYDPLTGRPHSTASTLKDLLLASAISLEHTQRRRRNNRHTFSRFTTQRNNPIAGFGQKFNARHGDGNTTDFITLQGQAIQSRTMKKGQAVNPRPLGRNLQLRGKMPNLRR